MRPPTRRSSTPAGGRRIGDRVRALRIAAGLTQTELAGARFSKEYVSQIERGKTRPTADTVAWLAERLGVDVQFLQHGVSADVRAEGRGRLARAEALSEAHRDQEAVEAFREARDEIRALGSRRARAAGARRRGMGAPGARRPRTTRSPSSSVARELTELPEFSDIDRADVLFRLGCCRYRISSIPSAIGLLDQALDARRALGAAVRRPPRAHPRLAVALPAAPGRLRGGARGRRACARARAGRRRPAGRRRRLLPGVVGRREDRPLGARPAVRAPGQGDLRGAQRRHGTPAG